MIKKLVFISLTIFCCISFSTFQLMYAKETTDNLQYDIVIMVDCSASMIIQDPEGLITESCKSFIDILPQKRTRVGIVLFDEYITLNSQMHEINTNDDVDYIKNLFSNYSLGKNTDLGLALKCGDDLLKDYSNTNVIRTMIIITDGIIEVDKRTNRTNEISYQDTREVLSNVDYPIYIFQIDTMGDSESGIPFDFSSFKSVNLNVINKTEDLSPLFNLVHQSLYSKLFEDVTSVKDVVPEISENQSFLKEFGILILSTIFVVIAGIILIRYIGKTIIKFREFENHEIIQNTEQISKIKDESSYEKNVFNLMLINVTELKEFYVISKRQATYSFVAAFTACIAGFIVFLTGIIVTTITKSNVLLYSTMSGAIIEIISGSFFFLYKYSLKQLNACHERLEMTEKHLTSIQLVEKITKEKQDETYQNIINSIMQEAVITCQNESKEKKS